MNLLLSPNPVECIALLYLFVVVTSAAQPGSQQQGHLYDVILTGASMENVNPAYFAAGAFMRVSRKSRGSAPTLDAFYPLNRDLPVTVNASWLAFQKFNNKWKESFVKGSMLLCDILEAKIKLYRLFYNFSNFPYKCPVKQGNYSIVGFKFDSKELPPIVPGNEWRLRSGWFLGSTTLLSFAFEFKIDRTREMRAKKEHHNR